MFKRILMAIILAVGVFAHRGGQVDAHELGTVYKPTYRHISSYDCTGTFIQVPNLENHPALFNCEAVVREYEFVCANPNGKVNFGNSGPRTVLQIATGSFTTADLDEKIKGRARKTLLLPETVALDCESACKARNRNWSCAAEFVTSVDVRIQSLDCNGDPTCSDPFLAFEAMLHCNRPVDSNGRPFTLNGNPPPGNGVATEYPCGEPLYEAHCDAGDLCNNPFP